MQRIAHDVKESKRKHTHTARSDDHPYQYPEVKSATIKEEPGL
jgi:hypothetical protein